jgi:MoxR-like ATPase
MNEILFELRRLIVGQDHLLECLLVALLARGHVLLCISVKMNARFG